MKKILAFLLLLISVSYMTGCGNHKRRYKHFASIGDITTLTIGVPVTDYIEEPEDTNKYTVILEKDKVYLFHTFNLSAGMDTILMLFDPNGALLAENDNESDASLASILQYQIPEDGIYCIVIRHKSPEAHSGMYDLVVEFVSDALPGDDTGDGSGDGDGDGSGNDGSGDGSGDDGSGDDGSGDDGSGNDGSGDDGSDDGSGDDGDGSDDGSGDDGDDSDDDDGDDDSECDRHRHTHSNTIGQGHQCHDD